jgi:hypothetical protein
MSHTVESLLKQFPDAQLVADIVLLYRDGKHVELGKRQGGAFNLTPQGQIFLENYKDEPKQEKAKPAKKSEKPAEDVDLSVE